MCESALEYDYFSLLEFRADVAWYSEQPMTIRFQDVEVGNRRYTPDSLARFVKVGLSTPKPALREVKYSKDLEAKWPALELRFRAAEKVAREKGWTFEVCTEVDIRTPLLDNAKLLLPNRRNDRDPEGEARIIAALSSGGPVSIAEFLNAITSHAVDRKSATNALLRLMAWHEISADLSTAKVNTSTLIWVGGPKL